LLSCASARNTAAVWSGVSVIVRLSTRLILATDGCRNETGWTVVASAAGRGIPEDVVWQLFEKHFTGWDGFSESDLASAIERTRPVQQPYQCISTRCHMQDA
jgi:hypothetical protein